MIKKYFLLIGSIVCVCTLMLVACKRPFDPSLKAQDNNLLVVEGFIDGGAPTSIHLSRVRHLTTGDTAVQKNELNARVSVEDDHQNDYPLTETGDGVYTSATVLTLDPSFKYRVHIVTSNSKEYESDFVPFKIAPSIDTITWKLKDGGVQLYLNAHDDAKLTTYYRWDYMETWEFHVFHHSILKYIKATNFVVPRTDQVFTCWRSDNATRILIGSTAKLTNDVVNETPIAFIENHNDKLSVLYSILVKQYALDINAYNYWFAMKSNTESTGSIFDPQPNESPGNIHSVSDPSERVIGFVSSGKTSEKRIFIDHSIVPMDWDIPEDCHTIVVGDDSVSRRRYFDKSGYSPISFGSGGFIASYANCVDCTIKGTNVKPPFWP